MHDKIRFGVAGTNSITEWFLKGAMEDARFELTAVCSRSMSRAKEFAARYGAAHAFSSISELAASNAVDAVYIAVPNSIHASYATTCINAGKHVLCEKPAASNANELRTVIESAKRHGVAFMEAMLPTVGPNFAKIREYLPRLGTLRSFNASYCQYSSRYDKLRQGEITNVFSPAMSGGATMDIGVYTIYPMIALLGKPSAIHAEAIMLPSGVDGHVTAVIKYPGLVATLQYSKIADAYAPSEISGEKGNLLMSDIHLINKVTYIPHRTPASGMGPEEKRTVIAEKPEHNPYYYETAEFINVIINGEQQSALNSWANSIETLEVADEIRRQAGVKFPCD